MVPEHKVLSMADWQKRIKPLSTDQRRHLAQRLHEVGALKPSPEASPGPKRLVAYVVGRLGVDPEPDSLSAFLAQTLPDYMVPGLYVPLEKMPLTPNGKIDRKALPVPDEARPQLATGYAAPQTENEKQMAAIWSQVLRVEQIGIHDSFFELGGDSILSIQIVSRAKQAGLRITPKMLFENKTIAELARVAQSARGIEAQQGVVTGDVHLMPIQQAFFEADPIDAHHYNHAVLLGIRSPIATPLLEQAAKHLMAHHDALRLRFHRDDLGWHQTLGEIDQPVLFSRVDLSQVPASQRPAAITEQADQIQTSLNLQAGPLARFVLFESGDPQGSRLLIVIHHLAVDAVSWRILLEDLETVCHQLIVGEPVVLPAKTTSFKQWANRLVDEANGDPMRGQLDKWLQQAEKVPASLPLDHGEDSAVNSVASSDRVVVSLSDNQTRALLHDVPKAYSTQINDVLLTALAQAFNAWTSEPCLWVDLEGHGREDIFPDIDLSRTVGWFTSLYPVLLDVDACPNPGDAIKAVKEQLRRVPDNGLGYGMLRYLSSDPVVRQQLANQPQPRVNFNYLGQLDATATHEGLFATARESTGRAQSQRGRRHHWIEINGGIAANRLQMGWTYSTALHERQTIERLANGFMDALTVLIDHCQQPQAGGYTPSDFAVADLDQKRLDKLIQKKLAKK